MNWHKLRRGLNWILFYAFVLMLVFAVLAPFVWMVISSISPQVELTKRPPHWIPEEPTLRRFRALIFGAAEGQSMPVATERFVNALVNSLLVSSATTLV